MGSPIKGHVKRKNTSPLKKMVLFFFIFTSTTARYRFQPSPHPLFLFCRFSDQQMLTHTSHPSGSRQLCFKRIAVLEAPSLKTRPLPPKADQKFIGTIPCSIGCITNLMVISQPLTDSRHGRIRV